MSSGFTDPGCGRHHLEKEYRYYMEASGPEGPMKLWPADSGWSDWWLRTSSLTNKLFFPRRDYPPVFCLKRSGKNGGFYLISTENLLWMKTWAAVHQGLLFGSWARPGDYSLLTSPCGRAGDYRSVFTWKNLGGNSLSSVWVWVTGLTDDSGSMGDAKMEYTIYNWLLCAAKTQPQPLNHASYIQKPAWRLKKVLWFFQVYRGNQTYQTVAACRCAA